ncbi:MAG: hypothetical protein Harvfovirus17_6 [Harvfovirus sp.]|uniref:Uncharacterized protein n=1 Tax=Harvfovirus sp. TaxID=2487768 RepID=A0A3G5A1P1_9VIRU|nr:MAG: hypothetical protein Harvfovirus17_6 [Harvfovirus sp.]
MGKELEENIYITNNTECNIKIYDYTLGIIRATVEPNECYIIKNEEFQPSIMSLNILRDGNCDNDSSCENIIIKNGVSYSICTTEGSLDKLNNNLITLSSGSTISILNNVGRIRYIGLNPSTGLGSIADLFFHQEGSTKLGPFPFTFDIPQFSPYSDGLNVIKVTINSISKRNVELVVTGPSGSRDPPTPPVNWPNPFKITFNPEPPPGYPNAVQKIVRFPPPSQPAPLIFIDTLVRYYYDEAAVYINITINYDRV